MIYEIGHTGYGTVSYVEKKHPGVVVIFIGKCEYCITTKLFLLAQKNLKRCQIHFLSEQELRADAF